MHRPRLDILQTSTPITPHGTEIDSSRTTRASVNHYQPSLDTNTQSQGPMPPSTSYLYGAEPQILSPKSDDGRIDNGSPALSHPHSFTDSDTTVGWRIPSPGPAMTPQRELENSQFDHLDVPEGSTQEPRPRPQALNTTAAQGVSLPSPSLSPVTAAAQLHNRSFNTERNTGARSNELDRSKQASQPHPDPTSDVIPWSRSQLSNSQLSSSLTQASMPESAPSLEKYIDKSLMCIPQIVDNFESMPEEIKKYVVFQVLRRCSKPVLHFVADVVNPSLKCDFLKHLPPELCEAILSHLDVRDLCSAAQVSKKWQQQVDLSEKVWRRVFVEDGFTLQEGELARAIREGWGWQTVSQPGDAELDLSLQTASKNEGGPPAPLTTRDSAEVHFRSKRKHKSRAKTSNKFSKRKRQMNLSDTAEVDEDALLVMTSATDGPYAAATAAAAAISSRPRNELHLWKSIYMRHHMIRKTWLREDVTPRHIAFRAHQRHVVTCLQFDADKILTGSDDANINVYDTQTGALRARLEGHEGGVWALQYEGNVLVSGSTDRSVRVWDIERGICTHTFQGHTSTVRCLQILLPTPVGSGLDGRPILMPKQPLIITGSRDSHLRVWKLPKSGDPHLHQAGPAQDESTESPYYVRVLTGHHHSVRAIAAHADTLVSGSYDCTVRVWKISTGETLFRLQGHAQKVYSVVLDTKRNRCISGSMDNVVKVWSLDNGMSLFNLEGHSSLVGLLDLQDDRLVSAAADSTLRIWDPENGHCKNTLTAHTGAITCFQHDGQKVISGSDRTLKMWNVISGELVKDLLTDLSGVWQVKFNERRCVAAVQRNNVTFIEVCNSLPCSMQQLTSTQVLDFGACRDGVPEHKRGKRILVDIDGREVIDPHDTGNDIDFLDGQ